LLSASAQLISVSSSELGMVFTGTVRNTVASDVVWLPVSNSAVPCQGILRVCSGVVGNRGRLTVRKADSRGRLVMGYTDSRGHIGNGAYL
jgi:hypothetical protein